MMTNTTDLAEESTREVAETWPMWATEAPRGDQAWSFLAATATRPTTVRRRRSFFMRVRLPVDPVTLGVGGVRVPGGLRRLQSGWNG
jgi:hypothetical protein